VMLRIIAELTGANDGDPVDADEPERKRG